jgi:fibronectin-binding autotransporter adhesin
MKNVTIPVVSSALALALGLTPRIQAQIHFDNGTGTLDFGTAQNWSTDQLPSVPGTGNAFIGGGHHVTFGGTMTGSAELQVGTDANPYGALPTVPGGPATLTLNAGADLTVPASVVIGQGRGVADNSGTLRVDTGGTLTVTGNRIFIGFFDNDATGLTSGTLRVAGGTVNQASGLLVVGGRDMNSTDNYGQGNLDISAGAINVQSVGVGWHGGVGHIVQTGGDVLATGYFAMGLGYDNRHGSGVYDMSDGTLTAAGDFSVHEYGNDNTVNSVFNQSGGTVNLNGAKVIGRSPNGMGIYNLSGDGVLNSAATGDLRIGAINAGATGELNVSGNAQVNVGGVYALALGRSVTSTGTVNQTGGMVTFDSNSTFGVWLGAGGGDCTALYNLNGGTLLTPRITPDSGTGTKGFHFDGGTLVANNDFTVVTATNFTTAVNAGGAVIDTNGHNITWQPDLLAGTAGGGLNKDGLGTLTLAGANSYGGATTVNNGTLYLTGSLAGPLTVLDTLAGEGSTTGNVTFGANSAFVADGSTTGPTDHFRTTGTINVSAGPVNISFNPPTAGTGIVVMEGASFTGPPGNFILAGVRGALAVSGNQLLANVNPGNLKWRGGNLSDPTFWGVDSTPGNFTLGGVNDYFLNGDNVTFDDTAATFTIEVQEPLAAGDLTYANATHDYFLSGSTVTAAGLNKTLGGKLTIANDNQFATVDITGGEIQLGDGTGAAGGGFGGAVVTNDALLTFDYGAGNKVVANGIGGAGQLRKAGDGALDLTGFSTFTGMTHVLAGILQIGNPDALGAATGNTVVHAGASLTLYGLGGGTTLAEPLDLAGTGPGGMGAIRQGGGKANTLSGTISLSADALIGCDGGAVIDLTHPAGISGSNTSLTIHNDGGSNINVTGPLALGSGGLTKVSNGTVTLSGINSYTGDTTIVDGRLRVVDPDFADTSTVTVGTVPAAGAVLELNFAGTDQVAALIIDGTAQPPGIYDASTHPADLAGSGKLEVGAASAYESWASTKGIAGEPFGSDYDGDRLANGLEWILGGNPRVQDAAGLVTTTGSTTSGLTLTFKREDESVADATFVLQWDADLIAPWTVVPLDATAGGVHNYANGVTVTVVENGAAPDDISVNIPAANGVNRKLFARFQASMP